MVLSSDGKVNSTPAARNSSFSPFNTTNLENDTGFYPNVEAIGWLLLVIGLGTVASNATFFLAYWKTSASTLHTPFSVYMLNLAISDFVTALFTTPGNFALYGLNKWPFSRAYCEVYLYVFWTYYGISFQLHLLISLNRLWAVSFPVYYRTRHTKRLAILICLGTYIYAHIWTLIGLIPDELYYRTENLRDCSVDLQAQPVWASLCNIVLYFVPEVVIIVVYPFVGWKVAKRRQGIVQSRKSGPASGPVSAPRSEGGTRQSVSAGQQRGSGARGRGRNRMPGTYSPSHFKVLTYLVSATVIFWTPVCLYFVIASTTSYFDFSYFTAAMVLLSMNPLITPLTYPLASLEWREAFKRLLVRSS